jgi:hypothetical protein
MHLLMAAHTALAAPFAVDVCATGGTDIVTGYTKIIDIGKYLMAGGAALVLVIYLIFEFVQESRSGTDQGLKVSTFIFHHILPVLLLVLSIGLLFAFGSAQFLGTGFHKPC